jgi:hypothetical protein
MVQEMIQEMVQEMVQDDADIPFRWVPHYAASSLLDSCSGSSMFSLIMPGSRVRVPPLLLEGEQITKRKVATSQRVSDFFR